MTDEEHDARVANLKDLLKTKRELQATYSILYNQSRDGFTLEKELAHDIDLRRVTVASTRADRIYQDALDKFIEDSEA